MRNVKLAVLSVLLAIGIAVSANAAFDLSPVLGYLPQPPSSCTSSIVDGSFNANGNVKLCGNQTYDLPLGAIVTGAGTVLDCQNARLRGAGIAIGIWVAGGSGQTIRNCRLENYTQGIALGAGVSEVSLLNNEIRANDVGINIGGEREAIPPVPPSLGSHSLVNNTLRNNKIGMVLLASRHNVLFNNSFLGNAAGLLLVDTDRGYSQANTIFGNTFDGAGIDGLRQQGANLVIVSLPLATNQFCYNGIGNAYSGGAAGPSCNSTAVQDAPVCLSAGATCNPSASNCCSGLACQQSASACEAKSCRETYGNNKKACLKQFGCSWYELNSPFTSSCTGTYQDCSASSACG
ncbi:MAG: right-handed parallel beta-helix repeat-containing protein [Candidatus Aenigmarchaeota archaeon]|nr:right-handed parallel beta-helix repeat-containing protein [Candidatus Aenigmarchaeota archaeon]